MSHAESDPRIRRVRGVVESTAAKAGVLARSRPPRRQSDLAMVFLRGEREAVLALPLTIFDQLDGYDVEIIRSGTGRGTYLLVLAVTESLGSQAVRVPERRAKLRRRLEREAADGR